MFFNALVSLCCTTPGRQSLSDRTHTYAHVNDSPTGVSIGSRQNGCDLLLWFAGPPTQPSAMRHSAHRLHWPTCLCLVWYRAARLPASGYKNRGSKKL